MLRRLARARQLGYVLVTEEFEQGHVAVAAPVRDFRRHVIAALNISAPKFRLGKSLTAAGREIKAAADLLSRAHSESAQLPNPATPAMPVQIHGRTT
jgi:DNA-binding IclR family transcriptional regulator